MEKFKYIANINKEEIQSKVIIPCIDENGNRSILVRNKINKTIESKFSTDNLFVQLNSVLYLHNDLYYFHIITSKKNDSFSSTQFQIVYDYIFRKIDVPIDEVEMMSLITSIEEFFRITPESNLFQLQVGVYGELLTIKYLYDNGYENIIEKYHNNFYSKHDIEINDKLRIEIKTAVGEKRIHKFKHNQIDRNDVSVYVCSLLLEEAEEGKSLAMLFEEIIKLYENPDSILSLEKLKKRCGIFGEKEGICVSYEKACNELRIINAINIPKLKEDIPNGITNVTYDVDCSFVINEPTDKVIAMLKLY